MLRSALLLGLLSSSLVVSGCDTLSGGPARSAEILAVQIDDAPLRKADGGTWDGSLGGGPEIYFRLFDTSVDFAAYPNDDILNPRDDAFVLARASSQPFYEDVQAQDFSLFWDIDQGFEIRDLRRELRIALFDYDPLDSDDPMIETEAFTLADFAPDRADGSVDTIVLEGIGADRNVVQVRLRVRYRD